MGAMPMQRLAVLVAAMSFASSALAQPDAAADYPNHPVRIIVSTSAGGGVDTVTRIIAAQLQEKLGQPFVVEDRGGGGGNIRAEAVYVRNQLANGQVAGHRCAQLIAIGGRRADRIARSLFAASAHVGLWT